MKKPIIISKETTLAKIIRKMLDDKISRLLVSDQKKVTSIITEKDLGFFLLNDTSERKLDQISSSEIMKPLFSVNSLTNIKKCAKKMLEKGIGSLGVLSGEEVVGIITKTDLVKYFAEHGTGKIVGEYMSPYYSWIYSDAPLYKIVTKMLDDKISRIILRNRDEAPVGIVSFRDLFRLALISGREKDVIDNSDPAISIVFPRHGFVSKEGFGRTTKASEIMKDEIVSVNYDDDLAKACNILIENNINGAGVLSANGALIGILSKTDVLKAITFQN